jgi:hypothetical protein
MITNSGSRSFTVILTKLRILFIQNNNCNSYKNTALRITMITITLQMKCDNYENVLLINSVRQFGSLPVYKFVSLPVCKFVILSVCPFVRLSVCQFVSLSVCQFVSLQVCQFASLLVCKFTRLSVCFTVLRFC